MLNCSTVEELKTLLESLNICRRCILRFLAVKEYTSYITKSAVSEALLNLNCKDTNNELEDDEKTSSENGEYPSAKRFSPSPCASCLGILQDSSDEMLSKIQMAIDGNEFYDFVLQVSIPVAVDLRDLLIFLHIKEQLKNSYTVDKHEIPSVKDVWKWVIGSQFGKITGTEFKPNSDFQISLTMTYPDTIKECQPLFEKCPEAFPNRRKRKVKLEEVYTRAAVQKAIESLFSEITNIYKFPLTVPDKNCIYKIQCNHSPVYLGGRYNKYSRELPQTPWVVDGERRMDTSVNELITDVVQKWIECDKIVFSASGREDVDVKMLGNGRPFVLEIINPRKIEWKLKEIPNIQNEINAKTELISVKALQIITKQDTLLLKEGEEQKRKRYSAHCIVKKKLSEADIHKLESLKDIKLSQKTPIRVLHRRTLATRERLLHSIKAEMLGDDKLQLHLETQAGTYIKEFVHGDFGRTVPSLGTLLNTEADILELDVESIELDWPPQDS